MKSFKVVIGLFIVVLMLQIAWITFVVWGISSVATSGFKAMSGNCGKQVGIESLYINGDLFCPSKGDK